MPPSALPILICTGRLYRRLEGCGKSRHNGVCNSTSRT